MTPDPIEGLEAIPGSTEVKRWEYDDGGFHIKELDLRADSTPDEIKAFYEPRLDAKEMPVTDGFVSIQNDRDGKHFEVNYSRGNDMKTVQILVKTPQP